MIARERLERRVERVTESGCWIWMGAAKGTSKWPYGSMYFDGRPHNVHRVSWQIFRGAIPAGSLVCHRCDVALCVNPDHLFLGTHMDNMRDMIAKGRDREGHKRRIAKISRVAPADREFVANSALSFATLARKFGVSRGTIQYIKRRAKAAA